MVASKRSIIRSGIAAVVVAGFCHSQAFATTLKDDVEYTLKTNPQVLAANNNRLASEQVLNQAKSGFLPTLDVFGGYGREHSKNPSTRSARGGPNITLNRGEANAQLSQNVFEGFRTVNAIGQAEAVISSNALNVVNTAQDIGLSVAEVYLNVLRREKLVALAKSNLQVHQRTYTLIKQRRESGLAGKADVSQAYGRLSRAKANYTIEKGNLRSAKFQYQEVVGKMPLGLIRPTVDYKLFPETERKALKEALEYNPELLAANQDIVAAERQYEGTKANNYPRLNVELSATRNNNIDGVRGINNDEQAMVTASYNLYRGGADLAQQRENIYLMNISKENRNTIFRQVQLDTHISWNEFVTAKEAIPSLKAHRGAATETVRLYREQFELGQRTLLDLLDSESEKFSSGIAYVNGVFDKTIGQYRVLNVTGQLIESLQVALPAEAMIPIKEKV